jgi:hypothetical protein
MDNNGAVTASEYDLFVLGYKFGSSDVSVVPVNTQIKIRNKRSTPRIFSSKDAALNTEGLKGINQNRKHFTRSKTLLDVNYGIRDIYDAEGTAAATSKGIPWEFNVLGKKRVWDSTEGRDFDWYFVELRQDIPSSSPYSPIVSKGSRRWIRADQSRFYPVASFEKFIADLMILNDKLDTEQSQLGVRLDSLSERITRLRQMTKESTEDDSIVSISKLFDEIIGSAELFLPKVRRLEDIDYMAGIQEPILDDFGNGHLIDTEMQLFRDYMGVEFGSVGNGVVVDLHHLFIGLDLLFHADPNKFINPFVMIDNEFLDPLLRDLPQFYPLGNNVDLGTWAGDIGAAPADYVSSTDGDYITTLDPNLSLELRESVLRTHYYNTRAKDDDLCPDIYVHLIYQQLLRYLQRPNGFRNLAAALYQFNLQLMNEGDKAAFYQFYAYLHLDPDTPFIEQNGPVATVTERISAFAYLWWVRDNPFLAIDGYLLDSSLVPMVTRLQMAPTVTLYARQFLRWLESHK